MSAAIPDGGFEHINRIEAMRNRIAAGETTFTLDELKLTLAWADHLNYFRSLDMPRLTALEAENAALKNDYEVEQRKRMFLHWSLVAIRAEGIEKPKDRAAEIAKARTALEALGEPHLERGLSDAVNENAALKAEVAEARAKAIEECAKAIENHPLEQGRGHQRKTRMSYQAIQFQLADRIRSLSTSQGEQER